MGCQLKDLFQCFSQAAAHGAVASAATKTRLLRTKGGWHHWIPWLMRKKTKGFRNLRDQKIKPKQAPQFCALKPASSKSDGQRGMTLAIH